MRSKRKRKSKRSRFSNKTVFILIILVILGLFLYALTNSKAVKSLGFSNIQLSPSPIPLFTPIPTAIPTLTPIPTPTPVPLVGYCLNVPVLLYHHIQPQSEATEKGQTAFNVDNGMFDQQMGYLSSQGYTTITAKALVDALRNKTQLPSKSILVTLDDGYKDNYNYAFPIFKKYNITANLLIPTGLLGGADYMSWDQLKEMKNSGLIYMINHTWSHHSINYGSVDKIKYEINTAKQQLQDSTGQTIDIFGYPYGGFNDLSISVLLEQGFAGAFSTIPGHWQCDSFIMTLHRNRVGNSSLPNYGL